MPIGTPAKSPNLLGHFRREPQTRCQLFKIFLLRRGIHLDGEQRSRIDLRRNVLATLDSSDQLLSLHRLLHFHDEVLLVTLLDAVFLQFTNDTLYFAGIDLTIRLGGIDHGLQDQFGMLLQFLPVSVRLRFRKAHRHPRGFSATAFQGLVSHGGKERHHPASQSPPHGPAATSQERAGKGPKSAKGEIVFSTDRLPSVAQDTPQQSTQTAAPTRTTSEHRREPLRDRRSRSQNPQTLKTDSPAGRRRFTASAKRVFQPVVGRSRHP